MKRSMVGSWHGRHGFYLSALLVAAAFGLFQAGQAFAQSFPARGGVPMSKAVKKNAKVLGVCSGPALALSLSPGSIGFGSVADGACASRPFTVTNAGSLTVNIGTISTYYGGSPCEESNPFSASGCSDMSLPPGQSCTGSATLCGYYDNSCPDTKTGQLNLFSNAPSSPLTASLTGTVIAAPPPVSSNFTISTNNVDFGNVLFGTASPPTLPLTITSTGAAPLILSGIAAAPPFLASPGGSCGAALSSGQSCVVQVTYTPSALGDQFGALTFLHNSVFESNPYSVSLQGFAVAPPGLLVTSPNFGKIDQGAAPVTLTAYFKNYGVSPVTPTAVTIAGAPGNGFVVLSDACSSTLVGPGGNCAIDVQFTPPAPTTTNLFHSDTMQVSVGASVYSATLDAETIPPPMTVTMVPSGSFDFGSVDVGASSACQDFVLTNAGSNVAAFDIFIPFQWVGQPFKTCVPSVTPVCSTVSTQVLGVGQSCSVGMLFNPQYAGSAFGGFIDSYDPFRNVYLDSVALDGTGTGPIIDIDQSFLSFGSQVVGTAAAGQTVTVLSNGTSALTLLSFTPPLQATVFPVLADGCAPYPRVLAPAASCTVTIGFVPDAQQYFFDDGYFDTDAVGGGSYVYVDGEGVPTPVPSGDFFPMSLSFGNVAYGATSAVQTFSFGNTGSAPMTISSIASTGVDAGDFPVVHDCPLSPSTLAPNACCTVQVRFAPTVGGTAPQPESSTVEITTDDAGSPHSIDVDGTSIPPPSITATPASVTFADTVINGTSNSVRVTLTNTGTTLVTLGSRAVNGDFSVLASSTCAPGPFAIGATCFMDIVFRPTVLGAGSGSVVSPFAGGVGSPAVVALFGNGMPVNFPGISLSTDVVDFGDVVLRVTATTTVMVSSTGNGPLAVTGVSTPGGGGIFSAATSCGRALAPGMSCPVVVSCTPAALGRTEGDLYVLSDVPPGFRNVRLVCTGVPVPVPKIEVSLTSVGFGNQSLGSASHGQQVTIRSVGTSPLSLTGLAASSPFSVSHSCPALLAPGSSCGAQIAFTPMRPGMQNGVFRVSSNDAEKPTVTVNLSGTGCRPFSIQAARRGINLCGP